MRAVIVQRLGYGTLKTMVRNSLEHAFVPGKSLWKVPSHYDEPTDACAHDEPGHPKPSSSCAQLLAGSARATLQWWRLEAEFHAFEHVPPHRGRT